LLCKKKVEDIQVARPRLVKLLDGEISLSGYSPDIADKLTEYIKAFNQPAVVIPAGKDVTQVSSVLTPPRVEEAPIQASSSALTNTALGSRFDKETNKFMIDVIKYNVTTKHASVVSSEQAGYSKAEASGNFKIKCLKESLI
jgi:hypothetical protein